MTNDSYKTWLDAMPIDDVRRRIERLERKLSDLHVLERLHSERHGNGEGEAEGAPDEHEGSAQGEPGLGEAHPSDFAGESGEQEHGSEHEHS